MPKLGRRNKYPGQHTVVLSFTCSPEMRLEIQRRARSDGARSVSDWLIQLASQALGHPVPSQAARDLRLDPAPIGQRYGLGAVRLDVCPNCRATPMQGYSYRGLSRGWYCGRCDTLAAFERGSQDYVVFQDPDRR